MVIPAAFFSKFVADWKLLRACMWTCHAVAVHSFFKQKLPACISCFLRYPKFVLQYAKENSVQLLYCILWLNVLWYSIMLMHVKIMIREFNILQFSGILEFGLWYYYYYFDKNDPSTVTQKWCAWEVGTLCVIIVEALYCYDFCFRQQHFFSVKWSLL